MHLPRLLLLPVLASLLHQSTTVDAATTDTGCPPATCGNLTITYPFWLGGLDRDTSSCGPPAFQLTCSSSASGAFLSSSYYNVLHIYYGRRSLVAVHALLAADTGCRILFNMSSAFAITDRFRISASNRELYVLSRCDGTPPPPGAVPVTNCSGNGTRNFAYLGGSYGTARPPANDGRCELTELLVLGSEAEGATSASYRRLIRGGFRLEWEPVGDCNACTASGGRCRYDNNTAAFACLCSDGSQRASTTCGEL
jgi:hypothetical protein